MYFDKRVRSSTPRTATILKFSMSRLFQLFRKRRKDKQQQRQILRKIDVNVNIYSLIKTLTQCEPYRPANAL